MAIILPNSKTTQGATVSVTYNSNVNPTNLNDSVDSAGLGVNFYTGYFWLNTLNDILYACYDDTPLNAIWKSVLSRNEFEYIKELHTVDLSILSTRNIILSSLPKDNTLQLDLNGLSLYEDSLDDYEIVGNVIVLNALLEIELNDRFYVQYAKNF